MSPELSEWLNTWPSTQDSLRSHQRATDLPRGALAVELLDGLIAGQVDPDHFLASVDVDYAASPVTSIAIAFHAGLNSVRAVRQGVSACNDLVSEIASDGLVDRTRLLAIAARKANAHITCASLACTFALVAAAFSDSEPGTLFHWINRQRRHLAGVAANRAGRTLLDALRCDGYPTFDMVAMPTPPGGFRRIDFDTASDFVRDLLEDSLLLGTRQPPNFLMDPFFSEFTTSLGFTPTSLGDFSVTTFDRQVAYFTGRNNGFEQTSSDRRIRYLYQHVIALLPDDQTSFTFDTGLPALLLEHHNVIQLWREGYRLVVQSPLDPPPTFPKWFLSPSKDELARTRIDPVPWAVDFSHPDPAIQNLMIAWSWECTSNVAAARRMPNIWRRFVALLDDPEYREPSPAGLRRHVSARLVSAYLLQREEELNPSGMRHIKGWLRSFLRLGEERSVWTVDPACYVLLGVSEKSNRWTPDASQAASVDALAQLAEELGRRASDSHADALTYAAFCVQVLTPLRIGNILALKLDDLVYNPAGHIVAVEVATKADGYAKRRIQLPHEAAAMLALVLERTSTYREVAQAELRPYLFLYPAHQKRVSRLMRDSDHTRRLHSACAALGIEDITPRNIRRRYETEVVAEGIRRNVSRLSLQPLTGHATIRTTERHYIRDDIRAYLEATHGIEIGSPPMQGDVSLETALSEQDIVEDGAGYCRNASCNVAGTVTCLMCPGFVTTPDCIPEMEEAVAVLDTQLAAVADNAHERAHLLAVKRLYMGYLAALYTAREEASE